MIYALITFYNPGEKNIYNAKKIAEQVDKLFICDNSKNYLDYCFEQQNIFYIFNNNNLGLSRAFNIVLKNEELNFLNDDFIIFFDQDSFINKGYIKEIIQEYLRLEKSEAIGALGPVFQNENDKSINYKKSLRIIDENTAIVEKLITSSLVCKYSVLKEIDFWNEDLFLDLSDWDLCFRINAAKMTCIQTRKLLLVHNYGNYVKKIGNFKMTVESPVREYYQTRESLYLLFKPYVSLSIKKHMLFALTIRNFCHILFLPEKNLRCKYIIKAYIDFRKKYTGALEL